MTATPTLLPCHDQSPWYEYAIEDAVRSMLDKLHRHHRPTYEHSIRVGELARSLAEHLNMPAAGVREVTRAALLHDVGKVAVPVEILDKPTSLTTQEKNWMDQHCRVGGEMLQGTKLLDAEAYVARHHHRWYAANNRLSVNYVEALDEAVDLVSACDAYDAITSDRPYSARAESADALHHIEQQAGIQFNPYVVSGLFGIIERRECAP